MDIQKFVVTKDDGTMSVDTESFNKELDAAISKAVETYKNGKGKEEMRKIVEDEAKMTAEQKLKQEREAFEQYKTQCKIELNRDKAKARMDGKGFTEKELAFILSTINENEEDSLAKIDELIAERAQVLEATKKSAIETLQQGQQKAGTIVINPDGKDAPKPTQKTASQILDFYRPQNKND